MQIRRFILLLFVCLCLRAVARAAPLDLGFGTFDLPAGVQHHAQKGFDSAIGTFDGTDGTPTVHYDLGAFASTTPPRRATVLFFRHGVISGFSWFAYISRDNPHTLYAVFPEGGPAFFSASVASPAERTRALRLILRYTPKQNLQ